MEALSRTVARAGAALICLAAASCATRPAPEEPEPERHYRFADIQSIPANAWIEQNHDAVGIAPMRIWAETRSDGVPKQPVILRAHDRLTGAWEQKVIATVPFPSRILFDLRPWLPELVFRQRRTVFLKQRPPCFNWPIFPMKKTLKQLLTESKRGGMVGV